MNRSNRSWLGVGLVVLATLFWSTAGVFITFVVRNTGVGSLGLAFWRVLVSGAVLFAFLLVVRPSALRVQKRDLPWLAGMGVIAVGTFQVLWILAILKNGASISTVIQCNAPIIVTVLARLLWREPLTWAKWAAIVLATIGTVLTAGLIGGSGNLLITPLGLLISLGSALTYAFITLFSKRLTGKYNPFAILAYSFGFAALALLPFQFGGPLLPAVTARGLLFFAGLVLITTIAGYSLYTLALRYLQASVAAIIAMTEVPFASFFGYVVLAERLSAWQVVGALVVIGGVVVLTLSAARPGPVAPAPATPAARGVPDVRA